MAMLEQTVARQQTTALMVVACETLQDTAGVLKESQREVLLLTLVEKVKSVLAPRMVLTQVSGYDLVMIAHGVKEPWHAMTLGQQVLTVINERLPIQGIQLRPSASIGIAMFYGDLTANSCIAARFRPRSPPGAKEKSDPVLRPGADGKGAAAPDGRERHPDRAG
jgi:GGDEF domain-containing protein